jgi:hypothetical protein
LELLPGADEGLPEYAEGASPSLGMASSGLVGAKLE